MPEPNYHGVQNPTIVKTLEESRSKAEKEVKGKKQGKSKGNRKGKWKCKRKIKEKEIKPGWNWIWLGKKHAPYVKEQYSLSISFPEHHIPYDVFSAVANLDGLVKLLLDEGNLYDQQNTLTNKKWEHF